MENNPGQQPSQPQESVVTNQNRQLQRRRSATFMELLMVRQTVRPRGIERQSRRASLMSLARRAVRHATQEPQSFASLLERDRLLQRWQSYTKALANYSSSWRLMS